jgi:hypothetical protein
MTWVPFPSRNPLRGFHSAGDDKLLYFAPMKSRLPTSTPAWRRMS